MKHLIPSIVQQFLDSNGDPLAGGKVYSYAAGTVTPLDTYSNATGTANANPVILDSDGRADIFLGASAYKFVLKTSADVTVKTIDNISHLSNDAVTTDKILDLAVTTAKLAASAVTTAKINDLAVTTAKLGNESVTTAKIDDEAVTLEKVAPGIGLNPPGTILSYGAATAPTGYLLCDGSSLLRASYAALFAIIGTSFGAADGTHFNVPDLRGRFLRGRDAGQARDPDAASRTAMNTGGATGDNVGSIQAAAFAAHTHGNSTYVHSGLNGSYHEGGADGTVQDGTVVTGSTGGNETRPINAAVTFIIKT